MNKESTVTPLVFKTRDDNIISGRNIKSDTGRPLEVVFSSSFFADDGAFLFKSRRDLQEGILCSGAFGNALSHRQERSHVENKKQYTFHC